MQGCITHPLKKKPSLSFQFVWDGTHQNKKLDGNIMATKANEIRDAYGQAEHETV